MVDEKWWDLSGWKDLDEIYNIDEGTKINQRSLEFGNNEIRFGCLGFRENERKKAKGKRLRTCGLYRWLGRWIDTTWSREQVETNGIEFGVKFIKI